MLLPRTPDRPLQGFCAVLLASVLGLAAVSSAKNACAVSFGPGYENLNLLFTGYHIDSTKSVSQTNSTTWVNEFQHGRISRSMSQDAEVFLFYGYPPRPARWIWRGDSVLLDTTPVDGRTPGMLVKDGKVVKKFLQPYGRDVEIRYGIDYVVEEFIVDTLKLRPNEAAVLYDSVVYTDTSAVCYRRFHWMTDFHSLECSATQSICDCQGEVWEIKPEGIYYSYDHRLGFISYTSGSDVSIKPKSVRPPVNAGRCWTLDGSPCHSGSTLFQKLTTKRLP
ncbi:MAG: hypothetical protein IPK50_12835 [Fibrobacterota bacterium]|nr:hypothetical protein [Fibrobacterota bacterium]QQS03194.1 MAG: hypothetical protein IPK50_12835 [Fibrobacterota bacterium]